MVHYMYPAPYSNDYRVERLIKKEAKSKQSTEETTESEEEEEEIDDLELEEENDRDKQNNQLVHLIDLCDVVRTWCTEIDVSIETRGYAHRFDPMLSLAASVKAAEPESDMGSVLQQRIRFINQANSVQKGLAPKTLYGCYCENFVRKLEQSQGNNAEETSFDMNNLHNIKDHMKSPYDQIYLDDENISDEDGDDNDGDYLYINAYDDNSEGDEDYNEGSDSE